MKSVVSYQEYNSVLCNGIRPIINIPTNLTFTFEDYIKSQIHFPMMPYVGGRELQDYVNSCKFLEHKNTSEEVITSICKVLKYFYLDLASSILESGKRFNFNSDFNFFIEKSCDSIFNVEVVETDELSWKDKVDLLFDYSKEDSREVILEMR